MIKFSPKMRTKKKKTIVESDEDDDPNIKDLADLDLGRIVRKSLNRMTNEQLIGLIASVDTETKQQKAGEEYHYYDDDDRAKFYEDYSENKLQHLINNIPKVSNILNLVNCQYQFNNNNNKTSLHRCVNYIWQIVDIYTN